MRRITVLGANGRMGMAVTRIIAAGTGMRLVGATTEAGHPSAGRDAGELAGAGTLGVPVTTDLAAALAGCDTAIDFTAPAATLRHLQACTEAGCSLVMGTTGLGAAEQAAVEKAGARIPVVYARNMSVGVTVLTELARLASGILGDDSTSRSPRPIIATRRTHPPARRCSSARPWPPPPAVAWTTSRSTNGTGSVRNALPARSASR